MPEVWNATIPQNWSWGVEISPAWTKWTESDKLQFGSVCSGDTSLENCPVCCCKRPVISMWLPLVVCLGVKRTQQTSSLFSFCRLLFFSSLQSCVVFKIKTPNYAFDRDLEGQQAVMSDTSWLWNVSTNSQPCDPPCINIIVGCLLQLWVISILWNPHHPYMLCVTISRELDLSVSAALYGGVEVTFAGTIYKGG